VHPYAEGAAEAAEAAAAQGRFWPMHDMLFTNQHALDDPHLSPTHMLWDWTSRGFVRARTCAPRPL
jgi:hypothetical protein